tara:strand:- start:2 stop:355 length:354 start_codon:yes stop_codon:yes gene_type:complete
MKKLIIALLILIANLSHASFPINSTSIDTTINKKSETLEQYQKRLIKQGFYNSENDILNTFTKKNKKSKKSWFLPSWKLWQKALLIILCIPIIIVIYYIIFPPSISFPEVEIVISSD